MYFILFILFIQHPNIINRIYFFDARNSLIFQRSLDEYMSGLYPRLSNIDIPVYDHYKLQQEKHRFLPGFAQNP
jgi:hypothetical protein